jgi:ATP-dependent DNA ligase
MLAKKYNDYKDSIDFYDGTWGMSPKLNGARCIATKDGLFTRTGEEYLSIPHIHEDLKPFFELYPNAILDGELYNYELRQQLNELMKLVRKTVKITVEELLESAEKVQYHVYDGYIPDDKDLGESVSYDERHDWIHTELDKTSFYYRPVPCTTITDEEQLMKYFNDLLEEGQEGVMLRKTTAGYENKRSKNLLKLKSESDDECEILAVLEGNGNWANKCKTFTVKWNDKVFDVSLKGSMEQAEDIWNNKQEYIGKIATFIFNDLSGLGIPNFARIDINNCFKS